MPVLTWVIGGVAAFTVLAAAASILTGGQNRGGRRNMFPTTKEAEVVNLIDGDPMNEGVYVTDRQHPDHPDRVQVKIETKKKGPLDRRRKKWLPYALDPEKDREEVRVPGGYRKIYLRAVSNIPNVDNDATIESEFRSKDVEKREEMKERIRKYRERWKDEKRRRENLKEQLEKRSGTSSKSTRKERLVCEYCGAEHTAHQFSENDGVCPTCGQRNQLL